MSYLHSRLNLNSGDIVCVDCDTQCNVMLLEDSDFSNYKTGRSYHYLGGFFKRFPARIATPKSGYWNVVLDLGGGSGTLRHSLTIISG